MTDNTFSIKLNSFNHGLSPQAAFNSLTSYGSKGQASAMLNVEVLSPDYITQGSALADLTTGTQAGAVTELINHILDKAVSVDTTYGIGPTKLFQISSTAVANAGIWPHTITGSTDGQSSVLFKGNLYYFYNKASGGDIGKYDLVSTFTDAWGSVVPTGAAALQSAKHPAGAKEDLMVFGNGRYVGTYTGVTATLAPTKLDFGNDTEVVDVQFNANQWWLAVNSGVSGTNKNTGQIFLWEASGTSAILDDETGVGPQKIGFLYPIGGTMYVAYQDLTTSGGYKIGYVSGRKIVAIGYFTGSLPTFAQKTLYKDTILFLSSGQIYSAGAMTDYLPLQLSQIADGGYATCGALASPFGTPMIASTDGGTNFRLAKFSGYDIACAWRSIVIPTVQGRFVGHIDDIIVLTNVLGAGASCSLVVEYNQTGSSFASRTITTAGKSRHLFNMGIRNVEDFRIFLDWSGGSATNPVQIRQIEILGHYAQNI